MAKKEIVNAIFKDIDTNRDGIIDKNELQEYLSSDEGLPASSYDSATTRVYYSNDNSPNRHQIVTYGSYGSGSISGDIVNLGEIRTRSLQETNEYLSRAVNVYNDPNPETIRRSTTEAPVHYEQRIIVRYLQPPELPEPGPLIVEEKRPPQPSPPPPLVISQRAPSPPPPPPLILRERPPTPPPIIRSETVTRYLPPVPAPPRSVIIQRFPPPPEKPRDILIERWIPYGPQAQRRTIVRPAAASISYPEPRNKVILYDAGEARVERKFRKLNVVREDPRDYVARYGSSLLDPGTLVHHARNAGVHEDITPPVYSSSIYMTIRENPADTELVNQIIHRHSYTPESTYIERKYY